MYELKNLDDHSLIQKLKTLIAEERKVTTAILWHLLEVQRRRLFSELGYPSLFAYCVQALGYSESAAQRRIEAMRLLQEMPEIEHKIQSGELSLSVAAQVGTFFRQEAKLDKPIAIEQKKEILSNLEGKSAREAQRDLLSLSSNPMQAKEKTRPLPDHQTEVRFVADEKLMDDFEKIKCFLAHQYPDMSWAELMRYMAEQTLKKLEQTPKPRKTLPTPEVKPAEPLPAQGSKPASRYIPAPIRRAIKKRDQDQCTQCGGIYAVQAEHTQTYAHGGPNTVGNLKLLCRNCNQRSAIKVFGQSRMDRYINFRRRK